MAEIDIEDINKKYDGIIASSIKQPSKYDIDLYKNLINELLNIKHNISEGQLKTLKHKHKCNEKNSFLYHLYNMMIEDKVLISNEDDKKLLRRHLRIKDCKSHSGVLVITVFMSAYPEYEDEDGTTIKQPFSCQWNCAYCPNEPGQPRSYLKGEPGVLRANKNEFNCVKQMWDRMNTLYVIGHEIDKLEVLVLGGTLTSYPLKYREQFCRDIYYSANVFFDSIKRNKLSLQEEKVINQTAKCRVIGLTLETRPDTINKNELLLLRSYGCTRVQLGVQHLHDDVLQKINRKCTTKQFVDALQLLKDSCYKVDTHWMPNLPGSSPKKDTNMLIEQLLGMKDMVPKRFTDKNGYNWEYYNLEHPEFQSDQWKVYPCATVPWTDIKKWYEEGTYKPYSENELQDILLYMKSIIFPWIRLNRIIRDIPSDYIIASGDKPNMRQELHDIMKKEGKHCRCIRCREVKSKEWDGTFETVIRKYNGSNADEYFISAESKDNMTLYGFVRLRLSNNVATHIFPELEGAALIRELHVYGNLQKVSTSTLSTDSTVQHKGLGKHLMNVAHTITMDKGFKKAAVIAGEGTKEYYKKLGYFEKDNFMIKILN